MATADELKQALRTAIGHEELLRQFALVDGTIKSVDWAKRLCVVTTEEYGDVDNVRLRGAGDNNTYGFVSKPTVNSIVIIGLLYNQPNNAVVISFTAIDGISLCDPNGNELFSIDLTSNPAKFVFNGGNNNGIIKLMAALNDVKAIQQDLNIVKAVFNAWTPSGTPADTTSLKTAIAGWAGNALAISTQANWEDTNIKH